MDDLSGLDWSSSSANNPPKPQTTTNTPLSFPTLRPTPPPGATNSGRSTPSAFANLNIGSAASRSPQPPSKPTTPANDSFATLLSGPKKTQNNLTLQERQQQLLQEKARQEEQQRKKLEGQYGGQHGAFWDGLGQNGSGQSSGRATPAGQAGLKSNTQGLSGAINKPFAGLNGSNGRIPSQKPDDVENILAAFNSQAPVDASSHFPPQQSFGSGRSTPAVAQGLNASNAPPPLTNNGGFDFDDDDDPFGLGNMPQRSAAPVPQLASGDDDDILGMLAKPVSEIPKPKSPVETRRASPPVSPIHDDGHPQSKAVAELVDMGFPADKAANALAQTDTGVNVQAAVGILLNQAHEDAKQKSRGRQEQQQPQGLDSERSRRPQKANRSDSSEVPWRNVEEERAGSGTRNREGRSPAGDKDVTKYAQEIGSNLFKSANSLWKTGQKKVQRAVADMQQEPDSSQPKWMRDVQLQQEAASRSNGKAPQRDVTDEAMMLEADGGRPQRSSRPTQPKPSHSPFPDEKPRRESPANNPFQERSSSQPKFMQQQQLPPRPTSKLTRQEVEEQAADVIVSSSRRRRPNPAPTQSPSNSNSPFNQPARNTRSPITSPPVQSKNPFSPQPKAAQPAPARKPQTPIPTRPKAPPRQIPSTSASALSSSASHRQTGTEAFKRGDYTAAHTSYSSALQALPQSHPATIIIFCNRALTNIKVGDPKAALSDAESAIQIIGVSRGEGEKIALGGSEGEKDMREFFGKALMRKAEALENMEKWGEAGVAWKAAVEGGFGGAVSIQGRTRCEKAVGGPSKKPAAAGRPAQPKKPPPRPKAASALADLSGKPGSHEAAAVAKLREANAQAERADDEKFALTDKVDAMLIEWKGTKADNLRALLGSLDKVLWPEAGWKKVGMGELVMPSKVKITYMKAIAKVHPDKISQGATTEQRMISASVFSTLNEAWDKFKTDNGL